MRNVESLSSTNSFGGGEGVESHDPEHFVTGTFEVMHDSKFPLTSRKKNDGRDLTVLFDPDSKKVRVARREVKRSGTI